MRASKRWPTVGIAAVLLGPLAAPADEPRALRVLGTHASGIFDGSAAEIVAHDPAAQRLYVTNAARRRVDVLDIRNPAAPAGVGFLDVSDHGEGPTSVDVRGGLVAVAVPAPEKTRPGRVVLFDAGGRRLASVEVGALPDMLTFTPDGRKVLVANEGEPARDCSADPEGSVSIIDVSGGADAIDASRVRTATFRRFNPRRGQLRALGVRLGRPGTRVAQDLEPEYIAVSPDSRLAWVTLQENDAIAILDIDAAAFTRIVALGSKDHGREEAGIDASDRDGAIRIHPWPVRGLYQADGIAAFRAGGRVYLATANEGDARDLDCLREEIRAGKAMPGRRLRSSRPRLQADDRLGRLKVAGPRGSRRGAKRGTAGAVLSRLYAFGARSFSIWTAEGVQIYDSGDDFERITAREYPREFNSTNDANGSFDSRSDDGGPEPEAVAVGEVEGRAYAFVGLERIGGIMVYDVTDPARPVFVDYVNNRDFRGDPARGTAGDLGPEGLRFIPAGASPTGRALLAVANEVSGTTTLFEVVARPVSE